MSILQLDHIALWVSDLDRSIRFYTEVVGLITIPERARSPEQGDVFRDMRLQISRENDMGIHLFQTIHAAFHTNNQPIPIQTTATPALGVDHYAFKVNREFFDTAKNHLENAGFKVRFQKFSGHEGFLPSISIQFSDPDGYVIEFQCYE